MQYCQNVLLYSFLISLLLRSCRCILMYGDGPLLPNCMGGDGLDLRSRPPAPWRYPPHRSDVEVRCRLRMNSRTADMAYRTARPILIKRGPVPLRRDLANHEMENPSSLATCAGCSRGSISFDFAGALMAHLLSLVMDQRWLRGFRKNNARYRQIIREDRDRP